MIFGDFPPNSRVTRFKFDFADASWTNFPTLNIAVVNIKRQVQKCLSKTVASKNYHHQWVQLKSLNSRSNY